ncbi:MAG: hypothetical protein IPO67_12110 [Deltaproteobacteria bacterium]|nr:hypothetical protein [Deltaproteobacteria bacterium]
MSLIPLLFVCVAQAAEEGALLWLDKEPDPRVHPELRPLSASSVAPNQEWGPADQAAIYQLSAELTALRPLLDEFDGELQIMSRLDAVINDLPALQTPAHRELLVEALALQGLAVYRYFQDGLATDPAAAPYRVEVGGQVMVKAWVDAVALDADHIPLELVDPGAVTTFDAARATLLGAQRAAVKVNDAPEGLMLIVDGAEPVSAARPVYVAPGQHYALAVMDGVVVGRARARIEPGESLSMALPLMTSELTSLALTLAEGPEGLALSPRLADTLALAPQPLYLAATGEDGLYLYSLQGAAVALYERPAPPAKGQRLSLTVALGGGWVYDGEYFLQNVDDGAPYTQATVNHGAAFASVGARTGSRWWSASAGVDLALPFGDYTTVVSGDRTMRLRAQPYVAAGLPWVQASVGWFTPYHISFGLRGRLPVTDHLALSGGAIAARGFALARDDGAPDFQAAPAGAAWIGVEGRLRVR